VIDPKNYPILSRAEGLDSKGLEALRVSLTDDERRQASEEAEKLINTLSYVFEPFIKTIAQAMNMLAPLIKNWYEALPQEEKEKLLSNGKENG
jgi:hypothetical protein